MKPARLWIETEGNILPMAAAGLLVMVALIGGGVDTSRAYQVQTRLQSACDAAVLAGRRSVTNAGFNAAAELQAKRYFDVNFDEKLQGSKNTTVSFSSDQSGNAVTATATTTMPMLMMQLFGQSDMDLTVQCSSTMGVGNSDVTMVLDVTGSMNSTLGSGTRLTALRSAMVNFYDTVDTATSGSNARIRYSIVPYSTTVNVGHLLMDLDEDYIVDQTTIQSRTPVFNTIVEQIRVGWQDPVPSSATGYGSITNSNTASYTNTRYNSQSSCTAALPANTNWTNDGSPVVSSGTTVNGAGQQVATVTTEQPQKMTTYFCARQGNRYQQYYYESYRSFFTYQYNTSNPVYETRTRQVFSHFEYRPVQYDVSSFKQFNAVNTPTGTDGTNVSSTWDGCIEERATVDAATFSFSNLGGLSPSGANDLDIDLIPDSSDNATRWAPLWRQVAYLRSSTAVATTGSAATSYCVTEARSLAEMDRTDFSAYANSLTAQGNTYLDIGLLWGARMSSPDGIFGDLVNEAPSNGGNVNRHIIFMTDGFMEGSTTTYQSYGIERLDRRVTGGSLTEENARRSSRFRAVCDAVKAKGIRLWVIGFASTLNSDLTYCASPSSSFTASSAAQLNAAFQEIAKQVGELRVQQ